MSLSKLGSSVGWALDNKKCLSFAKIILKIIQSFIDSWTDELFCKVALWIYKYEVYI